MGIKTYQIISGLNVRHKTEYQFSGPL